MIMNQKLLRYPIELFIFGFSYLSLIPPSAVAASITFDTNVVTGEFHNVSDTNDINENTIPEGFNNFFNDNFFLLGAKATDSNISSGYTTTNPVYVEPPLSSDISSDITFSSTEVANNMVIKFDWIFQGNSDGIINTSIGDIELDRFTVALVNTEDLDTNLAVFTTNQYGSAIEQSLYINSNTLSALETYTVKASLIESTDLVSVVPLIDSSSAVGIGNFNIETVPFDFSPSTGLLIVGGFWGLVKFRKCKDCKNHLN
jgi:hypothetical protein